MLVSGLESHPERCDVCIWAAALAGCRGPGLPEGGHAVAVLGQVQWYSHNSAFESLVCQASRGGTQRFLTCQPVPFRMYRGDKFPHPAPVCSSTSPSSPPPPGENRDQTLGLERASGRRPASFWGGVPPSRAAPPSRPPAAHGGGGRVSQFQQLLSQALVTPSGEGGGDFPEVGLAPFSSSTVVKLRSALPPARTLPSFPQCPRHREVTEKYCWIRVFFFHTVGDPLE